MSYQPEREAEEVNVLKQKPMQKPKKGREPNAKLVSGFLGFFVLRSLVLWFLAFFADDSKRGTFFKSREYVLVAEARIFVDRFLRGCSVLPSLTPAVGFVSAWRSRFRSRHLDS